MANEIRLIDANAVYALFDKNGTARLHVADIDLIPRVDAVEVVHGRWKYHDPVSPNCFCSVCHHDAPWDIFGDYHSERTNYCPNCGAKMDGDGNGAV